jgi:hypothetical protein
MNNYNPADNKGHFEQYASVSFTDVIKQINTVFGSLFHTFEKK